jgi:hypothetical protein
MGIGFSNEKGVMSPPPWYGQGAGCETPSSEPGCSLTDRWEEDFPLRQEDRALPVQGIQGVSEKGTDKEQG